MDTKTVMTCLGLAWILGGLPSGSAHADGVAEQPPVDPVAAAPEPFWKGFYAELMIGVGVLTDDRFRFDGESAGASFEPGWLAGASIGRQWSNLGLELEWIYRRNEIDRTRLAGVTYDDGDLSSTNLFLNLSWTFEGWGRQDARWRPYVGVGPGFLEEIDTDVENSGIEDASQEWVPAVQGILGIRRAFGSRWSAFAETRYLYAGDTELDGNGGDVDVDYQAWSFIVGPRLTF
jgi:opacity protein-like surface antigen